MPPVKWPVTPRPPKSPGSSAVPPKQPPIPPQPPKPPGGTRGDPPPKDPGDDTIVVGGPPTPHPEPPWPSRQPGMWSDASVIVQQTGGALVGERAVRGVYTDHRELRFADPTNDDGSLLRAFMNWVLTPFMDPGNATAVRPWMYLPPGANRPAKSTSKEQLMADAPTFEQEVLAALAELGQRLTRIEEHLAGVKPEEPQPPAPVDDEEFWDQFCAAADPDPEKFEPEQFTAYSRGRVLYQWRAEYAPTGQRIYPMYPVGLRMDYVRAMRDPASHQAAKFIRHGIDFETAVYAILSGRCDALFAVEFSARPDDQISLLAGKSVVDLFAQDIAGESQGGTPSGNEG